MEITDIPLRRLRVGSRLREIDYDHVGTLADSIREIGLIHPITVARGMVNVGDWVPSVEGYWLIAGAHRLEACKRLGWTEISANVVDLPQLEQDLVEIDENLAGSRLGKVDRMRFIERRKEIYEALHPETRHGNNQHTRSRQLGDSTPDRFTADTAAKTGQSERALQREIQRAKRIVPEASDAIKGSTLESGANLDALARLPANQQREVARLLGIGDVGTAREMLSGELGEMRKERKAERDLVTAWNRAKHFPLARGRFAEKFRPEFERLLGVHPKLRSKPKLRVVTADDEGTA